MKYWIPVRLLVDFIIYQTRCCLSSALFIIQGCSQDFFRNTHNSPNRFHPLPPPPPPPPLKKKQNSLIIDFGSVVGLRVFSAYEMTWATYEIICWLFGSIDWCISIIYHKIRVHTLPDSLLYFVTGFVADAACDPNWKGVGLVKSS